MCGIVAYAPAELVVTARAGTPLAEIEDALAVHGQMLPFEPPHLGPGRRSAESSRRDFRVRGGRMRAPSAISCSACASSTAPDEALAFGGQVIKNVAGFDVSRLMTGALGTLGVLTEISLKCLPRPKAETTRMLDCSGADAVRRVNAWGGKPLPVSATCFVGGRLWVRLSGAPAAVASAVPIIGGQEADGGDFWRALRDQALDCFSPAARRRDALAPVRAIDRTLDGFRPGEQLAEWGGALRWVVCGDAIRGGREVSRLGVGTGRSRDAVPRSRTSPRVSSSRWPRR